MSEGHKKDGQLLENARGKSLLGYARGSKEIVGECTMKQRGCWRLHGEAKRLLENARGSKEVAGECTGKQRGCWGMHGEVKRKTVNGIMMGRNVERP